MKHLFLCTCCLILLSCQSEQPSPASEDSTPNEAELAQSRKSQDSSIPSDRFKPGDIIFQISTSTQSEAIQKATNSKWSHMGVLTEVDNAWHVYEASSEVKLTPITEWIEKGAEGTYVVKRLKERADYFHQSNLKRMKGVGKSYMGLPYDAAFEWSNDAFYCSELVWKLYNETFNIQLGDTVKLREMNLEDPVVKEKLTERYGSDIPLNEPVITPNSIFESEALVSVYSNEN